MEVQRSMVELDHTQLGINIRTARIRRGPRQKELAELVHVTSQHISHIETARTKEGAGNDEGGSRSLFSRVVWAIPR